jgi:outer membrane protein insertion porin family
MEGSVANASSIEKAKTRLDRTGYFSKVTLNTAPVPGTDDQVDLKIEVEEQALGQFTAGLGFSSAEGLILDLGLQQDNFLGSGNSFGINLNNSSVLSEISVSYSNPYYTLDGVSRGFKGYYRERDFANDDASNYNTSELGGNIAFGYPIDENQRVSAALGVDLTEVKLNSGVVIPTLISNFVGSNQDDYLTYQLNLGWQYNDLNSRFFPTRGRSQSINLELAVPGGDLSYYKATYNGRYYYPLNRDENWVLGFKTRAGYADSLEDKAFPFFRNFFAGGLSSVRGYADNSLGPRDGVTNDNLGGDILLTGGVELIFPIPFAEDATDWRTTLFVDAGNVYSSDCGTGLVNCSETIELGDLRVAAGLGVSWLTAIGPLSVSFAQAVNEQTGDETDAIQFALGRTF